MVKTSAQPQISQWSAARRAIGVIGSVCLKFFAPSRDFDAISHRFLGVFRRSLHCGWTTPLGSSIKQILLAALSKLKHIALSVNCALTFSVPKYLARAIPNRRFIVPKHCSTM
jgi:hypothetical protein